MAGNSNSGRKKNTGSRVNLVKSLGNLYPLAIQVVEEIARHEGKHTNMELENAWRIIHQIDGKPSQRIRVGGDEGNQEPIRFTEVRLSGGTPGVASVLAETS